MDNWYVRKAGAAGLERDQMAQTIKKGDRNADVKKCQELLTRQGIPTTADGIFGAGTEVSVKQFQRREGLQADGVVGALTWEKLGSSEFCGPIDWQVVVALFSEMTAQKYTLHNAQCPSNPPGVSLKRLGYETTNCVQFTAWLLSKAFPGAMFRGDQWRNWMVSHDTTAEVPRVPGYGPRVIMEWGYGTTAPANGPWLIQYFTTTGGHSLIVVDHDLKTDKILTLEAIGDLEGAGWGQIGPLRDIINPGPTWTDKVTQTWKSRFDPKVAIHMVKLAISPESVQSWLQEGV